LPVKPADPLPFISRDGDARQVAAYRNESLRVVRRKCAEGIYRSYKNGERRLITWESVIADRERQLALGAQFSPPPVTGKRKPGRPRKATVSAEGEAARQRRDRERRTEGLCSVSGESHLQPQGMGPIA